MSELTNQAATITDQVRHSMHVVSADGGMSSLIDIPWSHLSVQGNSMRIADNTQITLTGKPKNTAYANEIQPGLVIMYDTENQPLGACLRTNEKQMTLPVQSLSDAVGSSNIFIITHPQPQDLVAYCAGVEELFDHLRERADFPFPPSLVPMEFTFHLHQFLTQHPQLEESIWNFIREAGPLHALPAMWAIETPEQFTNLQRYLHEQPKESLWLMDSINNVYAAAERAGNVTDDNLLGREITARITDMGISMFRAVIMHYNDPQFSSVFIDLSLGALGEMLTDIEHVQYLDRVPLQTAFQRFLSDFFYIHANDPTALAAATPIIEYLWMKQIIADDPEGYKQAAIFFYTAMGDHLNATASETTGDTPLELERLITITAWLLEKGKIPNNVKHLDAGGHDAKRLLHPYRHAMQKMGIDMQTTKVDLLDFETSGDINSIQADLADPDLIEQIGSGFNLITCTWSVINDISPYTQQQVLDNFSRMLDPDGIVIIDIPIGYKYEVAEYFLAHPNSPFGTMVKQFLDEHGQPATKTFFINTHADIIAKTALAGLRLVNAEKAESIPRAEARYETRSHRKRWTLVLEKVSNPHQSFAEVISTKRA